MKLHNARKSRVKGRHRPSLAQENFEHVSINIDKIDSRCRHNQQFIRQFVDKFNNLAREAIASGDRVAAEGLYQHADHYQRLLNERLAERVIAEKLQRETMEGQNESRNIYPVDAAGTANSANSSND